MKKNFLLIILTFCVLIPAFSEIKLKASKAEYFDSQENVSHINGIYPVKLTFTDSEINSNAKLYEIYFSTSPNGPFTKIHEISNTSFYFHKNPHAKPFVKYYYKIVATDNSKILEESNIAQGWGALTPEVYFMAYNKIITASHNKLVLMNKKKNLEKLGEEISNGNISGTLTYKTSVKGLNGVVTMNYKNYSDDENWIINGNMDTKANMSADGTMKGVVTVTGMYPGKVYYDNVVILDGKAGGGTYDVQPQGLNLTQLNFTITFKNIDNEF